MLLGVGIVPDDEPAIGFAFETASLWRVPLLAVHVWSGIPSAAVGKVSPFAYDLHLCQAAADAMLADQLAGWAEKFPDVRVDRMPLYDVNPAQTLLDASAMAGLVVVGGAPPRPGRQPVAGHGLAHPGGERLPAGRRDPPRLPPVKDGRHVPGKDPRPRRPGVVTAAELLSVAAFHEGRHAQAFPTFGSERTGAPVVSFCRIDDRADPAARAGRAPGRGDRPGPDPAAPGRRLRRAAARGLRAGQHRRDPARARRWTSSPTGSRPDRRGHRAGDRARARAPRPPAAERRAARRVRRAHRPGLARRGARRDPAALPRPGRRGQRGGRRGGVRARLGRRWEERVDA